MNKSKIFLDLPILDNMNEAASNIDTTSMYSHHNHLMAQYCFAYSH